MLDQDEVTKIMDIDRERIRHQDEVNRLKVLAILCFVGAAICLVVGLT